MAWRTVLQELVETGRFRTQRELVRALQARTGRRVNQASISRELTALGARKIEGIYTLGPELEVTSRVHGMVATAGGCLIVIRTDTAFASVVAQTIDLACIDGVLGTIAGDDTVFVAVSGPGVGPLVRAALGHGR